MSCDVSKYIATKKYLASGVHEPHKVCGVLRVNLTQYSLEIYLVL